MTAALPPALQAVQLLLADPELRTGVAAKLAGASLKRVYQTWRQMFGQSRTYALSERALAVRAAASDARSALAPTRRAVEILEGNPHIGLTEVAEAVGLHREGIRMRWNQEMSGRSARPRWWRPCDEIAATEGMRVLCDVMLDHVSPRHEQTSAEIFAAVRDDYGSCGSRRLYRALNRLVGCGLVARRGIVHILPLYRRAR